MRLVILLALLLCRMPRSSVTGEGKWLLILTAVAVELAGCSSTRLGAKPNQVDWPQAQISTDANRHQTC
jgi:hypothetical protein